MSYTDLKQAPAESLVPDSLEHANDPYPPYPFLDATIGAVGKIPAE
jgi:hypothetical protein